MQEGNLESITNSLEGKLNSANVQLEGKLNNPTVIYEPGKSAYDIAVDNGFEGTEQEWLESLKGERGPQGEVGPEGPQGPKGDTGSIGPKGDIGETGPKGDTGDSGESAYQVWLELGNTGTEQDFISSLKGEKGDIGPTGEQGPQGVQGLQGIQGLPGDDGYTPIRGTDYWTEEDIATINSYIDTQISEKITDAIGGEY